MSVVNVYYVANVRTPLGGPVAVPDGLDVRPISQADLVALAGLYARAYDLGADAFDDALQEMESAFDGTWGTLWFEASPVAWIEGKPIAVVQTVHRPAMEDAPDCPWLIEVFTDPDHRRAALARTLVSRACEEVADAGEEHIGLTVDTSNDAAVTLYRSLGFVETN
jgi:GNAT superfamily N-acetyltransferase